MPKLTKEAQAQRTAEMVSLRKGGASLVQIAAMFGVSEKCVQRSLKASGHMDKPAAFYRLKPKKQKLVAAMVEKGMSARQAAEEAGYSPATARSAGTDLLGPQERLAVAELVRAAVPPEVIAQKFVEGVEATEKRYITRGAGAAIVEKTVIDFGQRRQYIELWGKFTGALKDAAAEVTVPVQVILDL